MQPSIPIGTIGLLLLYFANTFLFHFIKVTLYPSTFIICIHVDVWAYPLGVRKWSHTLGFTSNALNKRIRSSVRDFWLTFAKHSAMDSPPSTGLQGLLLQTQQCEGPWVIFQSMPQTFYVESKSKAMSWIGQCHAATERAARICAKSIVTSAHGLDKRCMPAFTTVYWDARYSIRCKHAVALMWWVRRGFNICRDACTKVCSASSARLHVYTGPA